MSKKKKAKVAIKTKVSEPVIKEKVSKAVVKKTIEEEIEELGPPGTDPSRRRPFGKAVLNV